MTLRPFGPSVTLTALLRISTPRSSRSRASEERTSLADMVSLPNSDEGKVASGRLFLRGACPLDHHAHDVGLFDDQKVLAIDLDLGAGPLAEQHPVAGFEFEWYSTSPRSSTPAGSHSNDLAFLWLLLDGVGDDDAAFCLDRHPRCGGRRRGARAMDGIS